MILFSFVLINTLLILGLFGLTYAFYTLMQHVKPSTMSNRELPLVSVIVPARNEETKISRCLQSLVDQDYPNLEIVVIDDRSTDRTGEIIEEFARKDSRIKFVKGKDAPAGWIGKCNALAHAVGYASGDWFVFTDADTCHNPNSVRDAVSYGIENKADLVSFIPLQELGSFAERLMMPVLLSSFLVGDPFHSVNDPEAERAYAYGQYIICRRSAYLAVGGHQSVRDEIVEDHAMGRVFKEKGCKILVADGKPLYSVRMYTDLDSLWQGWTKNLYSLIDSKIGNLLLILVSINSVVLGPFLASAMTAYIWLSGMEHPIYLVSMTELLIFQLAVLALWFRCTSDHHQGVGMRHFFLFPLASVAISCLYIHAAYLVLSGQKVNWKGRQYTVNTHKTIQEGVGRVSDTALAKDD